MIRTRVAILVSFCASVFSEMTPLSIGQDAAYLNPLIINQWISLDENKSISGKLTALSVDGEAIPRPAIEVSLVHKGETIARAITEVDGSFQFQDVEAGNYSFVAQSEYSFATFGIHVLPQGSGSPSTFEASVATISSARAKELIAENWVPSEVEAPKNFDKDPLADKRVVGNSPKVQLQNGGLSGQVSVAGLPISDQDLTGNVAHIFQEGRSVIAAPVGIDGKFQIVSLREGVYDLVVVGEEGCAVIGFEAVGDKELASVPSTGTRFVSLEVVSVLNVELAAPLNPDQMQEEVPPPTAMLDAGFGLPMNSGLSSTGFTGGGGSFGGGGGGGGAGGGGLGGLLGAAGLAVGVAAISGDDDFNPNQATVIVP